MVATQADSRQVAGAPSGSAKPDLSGETIRLLAELCGVEIADVDLEPLESTAREAIESLQRLYAIETAERTTLLGAHGPAGATGE
jgi:hypothetical protein